MPKQLLFPRLLGGVYPLYFYLGHPVKVPVILSGKARYQVCKYMLRLERVFSHTTPLDRV